jgi:hypothetical protein
MHIDIVGHEEVGLQAPGVLSRAVTHTACPCHPGRNQALSMPTFKYARIHVYHGE